MPLAEHARGVAGGFQAVGDGGFRQRQAAAVRQTVGRREIEFVTESLLVAAGQQSRADRTANWRGDITAGETDAVLGDRIDARCRNLRIALTCQLAVAQIVGEDDEDVGSGVAGRGRRVPRQPPPTNTRRQLRDTKMDERGRLISCSLLSRALGGGSGIFACITSRPAGFGAGAPAGSGGDVVEPRIVLGVQLLDNLGMFRREVPFLAGIVGDIIQLPAGVLASMLREDRPCSAQSSL